MDARGNIIIGALILLVGLGVTILTFSAAQGGGRYVVAYGAIAVGAFQMIRGFTQLGDEKEEAESEIAVAAQVTGGAFHAGDYPETALRDGAEGRVNVRFIVDEQGRVTDPVVIESSGNQDLDDATVEVLTSRYTYAPARNGLGVPIAQYDEKAVTWRLPA
jgi:TonB family protein